MRVEELQPKPELKVPFKFTSFKIVPKVSGCYVLTTIEGEILYVGLSQNLNIRFQQHLENPSKINSTIHGRAVLFYFLNYDSKNVEKLERTWLNQYNVVHGCNPILNKVGSPLR